MGRGWKTHVLLEKFLNFLTSSQINAAKWIYTTSTKERFCVIFLWVKHQRLHAFEMHLQEVWLASAVRTEWPIEK